MTAPATPPGSSASVPARTTCCNWSRRYTEKHPDNPLAPFLPALRTVDGTDSHEGLDPGFTDAWRRAAEDPAFRKAQDATRDRLYFEPAVRLAKMDGLGTLGQFIYYDAMVLHGPGVEADGFYGIRDAAMAVADTASEGGDEKAYLERLPRPRAGRRSRTGRCSATRPGSTRHSGCSCARGISN